MKNFVFISPNFPVGYWKFCEELKKNGLRVLGIGDCPYDQLLPEHGLAGDVIGPDDGVHSWAPFRRRLR